MLLAEDLNVLLDILPKFIKVPLKKHVKKDQLIEIVLDIGRRPEARFSGGKTDYLSYRTIVWQDLDYILKRLGNFSRDNRAGIEKTLHRISSLRNRKGTVIGLTCRIGRAVFGTVSIIRDLLEQRKSILLLGRPGVGKTTAIREIARVLSDEMKKRVIIIDTSNEIAGDGDLPHPSIGKARRMQVSSAQNQHQVMIEAVENHMPEIIIIDEIGTELEAAAARTIAERGVQLVGTAHGSAIENLIKNPTISDLIGGIQSVTIGDEEAKRRGSSKSIIERKAPPTFEVGVEIHDPQTWVIHENMERSVDLLLQGQLPPLQKRKISRITNLVSSDNNNLENDSNFINGPALKAGAEELKKYKDSSILSRFNSYSIARAKVSSKTKNLSVKKEIGKKILFLYSYGISNQDVKSLLKTLNLPVVVTKEIQYADAILALGNLLKNNKKLKQISHSKKISIYTIHSNNILHIARALKQIVAKKIKTIPKKQKNSVKHIKTIIDNKLLTPSEETRLAIEEIVIPKKQIVDLLPQPRAIRKLQHKLIVHYNLRSVTLGKNCNQHIRIYPT
jgi:stage III sporulation protein SpoIIIAA